VSLTAADVAEIMRLVEQSTFDELTLELDGIKLCLRRGAAVTQPSPAPAPVSPSQPALTVARTEPAAPAQPLDPNIRDVTSPLLGTFYRAPKPGAPPFVDVGVSVEEDTIVAIVEVMKLMNAVRAGVRGTVTDILASDGALVEYGETLLRVRRTD
jgi:acetyl-CoA carboxylase biotin carboxyl carrier protein